MDNQDCKAVSCFSAWSYSQSSIFGNSLGMQGFDEQDKNKRSRRFCLISYIPLHYLSIFLERSSWISHFAYCHHDKDVGKIPHTHIIIYLYNAKTASAVKKLFDRYSVEVARLLNDKPQNTLSQYCKDVISQVRYLRHLDDPDKYQYEELDVIVDNAVYWKELCRSAGMTDSANNIGLAIFDDIKAGCSTRELIVRYGKEYIYHSHYYKNCIIDESREFYADQNTNMNYIEFVDFCRDILQNSPLPMSEINTFFNVFSYLQTQFDVQYGSKIIYTQTLK